MGGSGRIRRHPGGVRAEGFAVRRCWIVCLLALWASGIGCSGMTRRDDGSIGSRSGRSLGAASPPQTQVMLPPERAGSSAGVADLGAPANQVPDRVNSGIARYFPSLARATSAPAPASTSILTQGNNRPFSWFGLRKDRPSQIYTTGVRVPAGQAGPEPTLLPVALQVPARTGDGAVLPTSAEVPAAAPGDDLALPGPSATPEVLPSPSAPAIDPPAAPKDSPPSPTEPPAADPKAPEPPAPTPPAPLLDVVPPRITASDPSPGGGTEAVAGVPARPDGAVDVRERSRLRSFADLQPSPAPAATVAIASPRPPSPTIPASPDDRPSQAAPPIDPTKPLTLPDATLPASYSIGSGIGLPSAQGGSGQSPHVHASEQQVRPTAQSGAPTSKKKPCPLPGLKRWMHRVVGYAGFGGSAAPASR